MRNKDLMTILETLAPKAKIAIEAENIEQVSGLRKPMISATLLLNPEN